MKQPKMPNLPKPNIKKPRTLNPRARFSNIQILSFVAVFALIGGFVIWKSFAATTISIPTYEWTLTPNYTPGQDDPSTDYQAIWLGNPNGTVDIDATQNQDWWFAWNFYIDPSWDTTHQGNWGRMFNFHNTNKEPNGWGWSQGPGTSANAIDYIGGNLMYHTEPGNNRDYVISANMQKGVWHSLLGHFVFGRTDGSTARPGHVQLWFDGSDTPIDTGDINTLYKFGPDSSGNYYIQKYIWLWTGFYTQNIPDGYTLKAKQAYVRYGHTLDEALADNGAGGNGGPWALSNIYNNLGSAALGPATYSQIASRTNTDFQVPPSLVGTSTTPPATSTKPTIPTGLVATAGDKQVVLKWNTNPASDNVDYYQVYEADQNLDLNIPASQTSYTVTKDHLGNALANGTAYSFRISAHNSAGYGDWTNPVSATPVAPISVSPPTVTLTVNPTTITSGSSSTLSWSSTNASSCSASGAWSGSKALSGTQSVSPTSTSSYSLSCLNTTGSATATATITVSAPPPPLPPPSADATPPSTPANFKVTSAGKSSVTLAWDASTDNVGVAGYRLYRGTTNIYDGSALNITNYSLSPGASYSYYVTAYDKAGNTSAKSPTVCVGKWTWWSNVTRSRSWSYC